MTEREKMHSGELYLPDDPDIVAEQTVCLDRLYDYNQTRPTEGEKRAARCCGRCSPRSARAATSSRPCTPTGAGGTSTLAAMSTPTST